MTIQEKIKQDLTAAIKTKDDETKNALRVAMGEFGRSDKKVLSDDDVIKTLKKLIKSEKELLQQKGAGTDSPFIQILTAYLPTTDLKQVFRGRVQIAQVQRLVQQQHRRAQHLQQLHRMALKLINRQTHETLCAKTKPIHAARTRIATQSAWVRKSHSEQKARS